MRLSASWLFLAALGVALVTAVSVRAHGVRHQIDQAPATVITLTYDDGEPLAGARFEAALIEPPSTPPQQAALSGWTDERGRAVVLADVPGRWQLRAFANDGHGARVEFDVGENSGFAGARGGIGSVVAGTSKWLGFVALALVFVALWQWLRMRRRRTG